MLSYQLALASLLCYDRYDSDLINYAISRGYNATTNRKSSNNGPFRNTIRGGVYIYFMQGKLALRYSCTLQFGDRMAEERDAARRSRPF